MTTGRHGRTVNQAELIKTVAELAHKNQTVPGGGVTVESIAEELGFKRATIGPYCRQLTNSGELKRVWGIGPNGPKQSYLPAHQ